MTYNEATNKIGNRDSKKIGNNTYLVRRENGDLAVRLHNTDILTFRANGDVVVKTDGWTSVTTKARINEHLPMRGIFQKANVWYWTARGNEAKPVKFEENDVLSINGEIFRNGVVTCEEVNCAAFGGAL